MTKRLIILVVVLLFVGILFQVVSLLRLRNSVAAYELFWGQKANLQGNFIYIALGDSTAQGIGASQPLKGYVGLLASRIEQKTGKTVRIVNLSVSGAKVQDVIEVQLPQLKHYKPDLVTISIGSNDIANDQLANFEARFEALAAELPPETFVANVPYFGGRIRKNTEALKANELIKASAEKHRLKLVDVQTPLREQNSVLNYSSDLFHPSDRAYRIWESAFWKAIEQTIERNSLGS